MWITVSLSDSLDGSTSVVEAGLVQQQTLFGLSGLAAEHTIGL